MSDSGDTGTLLRHSGLTTVAAGVAVATGLVLDVVIATTFGAGPATDAFFVGARIPLGIVAIVMVGANQALVPAFATSLERAGEDVTWRTASILLSVGLAAGLAFAGLVSVLADPLMRLTAPGLPPTDVALAASLARVTFLVVPLVVGAEVLRSLLNARYAFVAPAAMHAVMNGVAAAIVIAVDGSVRVVAWAYVAGALAQLVFVFSMARVRGFRFRPSLAVRDAAVGAVARLSVRPLLGAGLNPLARVGEQAIVSYLPSGSISILNYGYRLISAIGGSVLFRSVVVALLPRLTSATARGDTVEVSRLARLGIRIMFAVSLGLTPFMAVLATPVAVAVFGRGNFTREDATLLGVVLAVYAGSLVGSGVQRGMLTPFYARLDTRTPLRNTLYGVAAGLAFVPIFVLPFGNRDIAVVGVGIAYSLAQYVHVAHAWWRLRAAGVQLQGVIRSAARFAAASAASGAVLVLGFLFFDLGTPTPRWELLGKTALVGLVGVVAGGGVLAVVGKSEMRALRGALRTRRAQAM